MTDEVRRQALIRDLGRRLQLASVDEIRVVDRVLDRLEQHRFTWRRPRHPASSWHLAQSIGGSWLTRCVGRWSERDTTIEHDAPPVADRCLACQRAAWSGADLDMLIAAVHDDIAAEDRERAGLREAARAEMLGPVTIALDDLTEPYDELAIATERAP